MDVVAFVASFVVVLELSCVVAFASVFVEVCGVVDFVSVCAPVVAFTSVLAPVTGSIWLISIFTSCDWLIASVDARSSLLTSSVNR
ncbi:hypothetical protein D3C71_1966640 [compost metagenome]